MQNGLLVLCKVVMGSEGEFPSNSSQQFFKDMRERHGVLICTFHFDSKQLDLFSALEGFLCLLGHAFFKSNAIING